MKALVTGATGLLGNNLVRQLLHNGVEVRAMSSSSAPTRAFTSLDVERVAVDVRDADGVAAATEGVDVVYHCAGCVRIGWSDGEEHQAINFGGAKNVADALRGRDVRLVHVSSVNALGIAPADGVADEETYDERTIQCPYMTSKRAGQDYVLDQVRAGDLDAVVVLPGFLQGPWDWKPSSGQMLLSMAKHFTPMVPMGGVSVVDVRDVAAGMIAARERGTAGRTYILAGHNLAYRQLWEMMAEVVGVRAPRIPLGPVNRMIASKAMDLVTRVTGREPLLNSAALNLSSKRLWFSSQRATEELGYRFRPAMESLQDAWRWLVQYQPDHLPARARQRSHVGGREHATESLEGGMAHPVSGPYGGATH